MTAWERLGLTPAADEREIKKSYARLLKTTRPDDDPVAFQALRNAYEEALAQRLNHSQGSTDQTFSSPVHVDELPDEKSEIVSALFKGLDAENLDQRWQQALQLDCTEAFKLALHTTCIHPSADEQLIHASLKLLHWLSPLQQISLKPGEETRLTDALLKVTRQRLERYQALSPVHFQNELRQTLASSWSDSFYRKAQIERIALELCERQTDLELSFIEGTRALFDIDRSSASHQERWRHLEHRATGNLIEQHLQILLDNPPKDARSRAVHLLCKDSSLWERAKIRWRLSTDDWTAVERLRTVAEQHPNLQERFPGLLRHGIHLASPREVDFETDRRIWYSCAFFIVLYAFPIIIKQHAFNKELLGLGLAAPFICVVIARMALYLWQPLANFLCEFDHALSERALPESWYADGKGWLVIHHGIPLALLGYSAHHFLGNYALLILIATLFIPAPIFRTHVSLYRTIKHYKIMITERFSSKGLIWLLLALMPSIGLIMTQHERGQAQAQLDCYRSRPGLESTHNSRCPTHLSVDELSKLCRPICSTQTRPSR